MTGIRKFLVITILIFTLAAISYITILYYFTFSDGKRAGELIKFSHKGYLFKTYEGELSQGMTGNKIFTFSVMDSEPEVIKLLEENQGKYIELEYVEKLGTMAWWGDSKYFIIGAKIKKSPHFPNK